MRFAIIAIASYALIGICATNAQRVYYQRLPYYRRPTRKSHLVRVRRQTLSGALTSSANGGADARIELSKVIGTPQHHIAGKLSAAGNTEKGPVTTTGALNYNNNGFGASLVREHVPGVRDTFTQSATANLISNGEHSLDAKAFTSQNKLANGFKFERNGAGLDYSHVNGHGASLTHSNFPGIGKQLSLDGRANLWSSQDHNTRLDLTGSGSKWTSGRFGGKTDFGAGLGLTHIFG